MSGFYLMHRGWQDHSIFRADPFSRRDAFVWMIEQAAFRDGQTAIAGAVVKLCRGQFSHSIRHMAKVWKWDEARVRRFLKSTQDAKIIDASSDAGQTVITICNYDKYQAPKSVGDAGPDAAATQQCRGNDANKKEGKEERKEEAAAASAAAEPIPYAFAGHVIRLNKADLEMWRKTFSAIPDLNAELVSLDAWMRAEPERRKGWFQRASGALNRKHQELLAARAAASSRSDLDAYGEWVSPC